jgi:TolB-like protein/class 3 adenylate cyclase/Tfp pilus assembly protein PilF
MSSVRRLTAILAADVAGYSSLMGSDEEGTHERLKTHLRELVDPKIQEHRGRVVKNTGDGFLAEFPSVVDAVRCGVEVQRGVAERNEGTPPEKRIEFRVGINLGDVIAEEHDIFGDGVNVAARLEGLAEPGGVFISNTVHDHVRDRLPFGFEDLGEQQVKNIARPVRVYRVHDLAVPIEQPWSASLQPLPLRDKPSIAALPFANMSGDPEQEYFVDGMVEEIITALSRIRWLFVIARNSSFTYKGHAVDLKQVGRELGARYVLEGSVRKGGNRVRITAQLIEAVTGTHLWADRFDGSLEDVFELQDKVAISVAGVIEPTLQAVETARSAGRPTDDLTAYDLYLRAYAMLLASGKQIPQALGLLEQAIARDPGYGPALAWASVCCMRLCGDGSSKDQEADCRKGADYARRALQVAADDPAVLANSALALAFFGEDIGAMMALVDRALALNPSFARGWYISGTLRWEGGQPDVAIKHAETALRLSPRSRIGAVFNVIGGALFVSRRFDEAIPKLLLAIQDEPNFPQPHRLLAACYAHLGRLDEAHETIARLRAITPVVVTSGVRFRNSEHRELYLSGLHLAAERPAVPSRRRKSERKLRRHSRPRRPQ